MILVIDDDSAIRTSLSFMLKRLKYEVQAVATPKEAIAIVPGTYFDGHELLADHNRR